jgi:two-component system OmpR family response regulator
MQTSHLTAILIEDDPDLARAIQAGLGDEGIAVQWFDQTTSARSACMRPDTDVIILDRMLPGQNGMEFLKSHRSGDCGRSRHWTSGGR